MAAWQPRPDRSFRVMVGGERSSQWSASLPNTESTEQLGSRLAATLPQVGQCVIWLEGNLGAGKTTLARALLRGLGVSGPIRSPTYTLIERYKLPSGGEAAHLDLYRISDPEELDYLALDELSANARLWLVEWPQHGAGRLPSPDLSLALIAEGAGRELRVSAASDSGKCWLADLRCSLAQYSVT